MLGGGGGVPRWRSGRRRVSLGSSGTGDILVLGRLQYLKHGKCSLLWRRSIAKPKARVTWRRWRRVGPDPTPAQCDTPQFGIIGQRACPGLAFSLGARTKGQRPRVGFLCMGGAADFKVGYKTGFASGVSEKNFVPLTFPNVGYKQANISQWS